MNEERLDIDKALEYLTLDEKIRMLSGDGTWRTFSVGELPAVRMADGPNGLRLSDGTTGAALPSVCFPTESMLACSWDPALLYSVGATLGKQATALGVNVLLAPGVNVKRHPLGGRNFEYFSEDGYLSGELGKAYVQGVQSTGVGACVKHFAANSQEYDRMYSDSVIDARTLHEVYLKPFRTVTEAAPAAVMCAYNKLNGQYCSQNRHLLTDILREQWGYEGTVISDWGAVRDRALSLKAGLDLAMPDSLGLFEQQLKQALERGEITESDIDRSVARILALIDDVFLEPYGDFDADEHGKLAYNAAASCVTLLKNQNGFLPLTRDMKITVCGEIAETALIQGGGSSCVTALKAMTPIEALTSRAVEFSYCRGYSPDEKQNAKLIAEATELAADSDCVIVYVGQPAPIEGIDRKTLDLPAEQNELIAALTGAGRRVAAVVCTGGPVAMPWCNRVHAIVYAGLNGQAGALAAADVLFGRINPCGKLAETFPTDISDLGSDFGRSQTYYREGPFVGYRHYDATGKKTLFPFGHGLSFSDITYSDFGIKRVGADAFDVTLRLTNNSVRDGCETVQIYASDRTGAVLAPVKTLCGYQKVFVEGQTSTDVTVRVNKSAFEFYHPQSGKFVTASGKHAILVAASAQDIKHEFTVDIVGDFTGVIPYPDSYKTPIRAGITDADFAELYGGKPPEPASPPKKGEFDTDSCVADISRTLIGKIVKRVALSKAKSAGAKGSPEREAFTASALRTPISAVCAMSDGAMSLKTARAIIAIANGKIVGGLKILFSKKRGG